MQRCYDFLTVGGGIMGLTLSRALKKCFPDARIAILEKEDSIAFHASGRNSGVLHAGFYYTSESLKARFSKEGNRLMTQYCLDHGIPIKRCGKVVVAKNDSEIASIEELKRRGDNNGIDLRWIDEKETAEIDPNILFFKKALYSPTTSSVDPLQVCNHMASEILDMGISIRSKEKYIKPIREGILTDKGEIIAGTVINAGGLYADKIAHDYGQGKQYTMLPFKGLYLKSDRPIPLRTHVYPVPHLGNPWLGVHFTLTVDGLAKIGPTAIPAFWRENYSACSRFNASEMISTLLAEAILFLRNDSNVRSVAMEEFRKYTRSYMIKKAALMVKELDPAQFSHWGRPGIRAQLYDKKNKCLVKDFIVEGDKKSVHILNAVSPAFTCSLPFSKWIIDKFIYQEFVIKMIIIGMK